MVTACIILLGCVKMYTPNMICCQILSQILPLIQSISCSHRIHSLLLLIFTHHFLSNSFTHSSVLSFSLTLLLLSSSILLYSVLYSHWCFVLQAAAEDRAGLLLHRVPAGKRLMCRRNRLYSQHSSNTHRVVQRDCKKINQ